MLRCIELEFSLATLKNFSKSCFMDFWEAEILIYRLKMAYKILRQLAHIGDILAQNLRKFQKILSRRKGRWKM